MCRLTIVGLFVVVALTPAWAQNSSGVSDAETGESASNPVDVAAAIESFTLDNPGVAFYMTGERITRVYGPAFTYGASAENAADLFLQAYSEIFGVRYDELVFERTGQLMLGKFTAVYYTQRYQGLPVDKAGITLLVRSENNALVLASVDLHDFRRAALSQIRISGPEALAQLSERYPTYDFGDPEMLVLPTEHGPVRTYRIVGETDSLSNPEKYAYYVDAGSADALIVQTDDLIIYENVVGNVSGWATQGLGSDRCAPDGLEAMPWASVQIVGGASAFTDENGDFEIANGGNDPVTVRSFVRGRYFNVINNGGSNAILSRVVTPPGPADFEHNPARQQFTRAEVNGYIEANVVRDYTLRFNPDFPVIKSQINFTVNVNVSGSCNAFYRGTTINFFRAGGSCPNMAYGTIVHHEYGHHLVAMGGSGQGQYGEGTGDTMGVLIMDDPRLAPGFFGNCNSPLRDARNFRTYPCGGGIHDCGQLLSGCVWDTRNALKQTNPDTYREIISFLFINSVPLHRGNLITPEITIDFVTLDDDDGDIRNGSPHYEEIDIGFGRHKMPPPALVKLILDMPDGQPDLVDPSGGTKFRVIVTGVIAEPEPGTGKLHIDTGGGFKAIAMKELEENVYDAVFPAIDCGKQVNFFVSAETTDGDTITEPSGAPTDFFEAVAAVAIEKVFQDDFQSDKGWTVVNENVSAGGWERATPNPNGGDSSPTSDYDGSGKCYITGAERFVDLDGGPTRLISPTIDMSGGQFNVSYARYFVSSNDANDNLSTEISNDDGKSWTLVEKIGHDPERSGWQVFEFNVADFVQPTATVRVRFSATDVSPNSPRVEAGIDTFRVDETICGTCDEPCDTNCDGSVDLTDVEPFIELILGGGEQCQPGCSGDTNRDGSVDLTDVEGFIACLLG